MVFIAAPLVVFFIETAGYQSFVLSVSNRHPFDAGQRLTKIPNTDGFSLVHLGSFVWPTEANRLSGHREKRIVIVYSANILFSEHNNRREMRIVTRVVDKTKVKMGNYSIL